MAPLVLAQVHPSSPSHFSHENINTFYICGITGLKLKANIRAKILRRQQCKCQFHVKFGLFFIFSAPANFNLLREFQGHP